MSSGSQSVPQIFSNMTTGIERDDIEFRGTISSDLLNTTFKDGSPASNVEKELERVLEGYIAPHDESSHSYSYHQAAQVIRTILKSWRMYDNKTIGEQFEPGHPLDGFDFQYTAIQAIKEDYYNQASLPFKIMRCFTTEMKVHLNRHEFTSEKLQGIINGASKAYLNIMAVVDTMTDDAGSPSLGPDSEPLTATYTATTSNPSHANTRKRKELSSSSDDDQTEKESQLKSHKRTKQSAIKGHLTPGGEVWTGPAAGAARSGQGNFNHGRAIRWTNQEDEWARDQLRVNPKLYFTELMPMHNQRWEGTVFTDGTYGSVTRGKRSAEALQRRFVKLRQELREAMKGGSAFQAGDSGVGGGHNASIVNPTISAVVRTMQPQSQTTSMGSFEADQVAQEEGGDDDNMRVESAEVQSLTDGEKSDNDPAHDLEELERHMDAGETFEDK